MNFAPFNILEFDGAFLQIKVFKILSVPDPWRSTAILIGPDPYHAISARVSYPPVVFVPPIPVMTPGTTYVAPVVGVDNTPNIQAALNAASPGWTVQLGPYYYLCNTPITIPAGVSLVGTWNYFPDDISEYNAFLITNWGTVLAIGWNPVSPTRFSQAFLTITNNQSIEGIGFYDTLQIAATSGTFSPTVRPYFIGTGCIGNGTGANGFTGATGYTTSSLDFSIKNCSLFNPYYAIRLTGAARFLVEDVYMGPTNEGLWVDDMQDASRISRCHIFPQHWFVSGSFPATVQSYLMANLIAYRINRVDSLFMTDSIVFCANQGANLSVSPLTGLSLNTPWFFANGCAFDVCNICVYVDYSQSDSGARFSNCSLTAITSGANNYAVYTGAANQLATFTNCFVMSETGHEAVLNTGTTKFVGCDFGSLGQLTSGSQPSIAVGGGNLVVSGCSFPDARPQINMVVSSGSKAIFCGNLCGSNGPSFQGNTGQITSSGSA